LANATELFAGLPEIIFKANRRMNGRINPAIAISRNVALCRARLSGHIPKMRFHILFIFCGPL